MLHVLGPLFGGKPAINDIAPNAQLRIRSLKVCGMLEKKDYREENL